MAVNGNVIIVKKGGTAIAATKSNEITVDCETIEIASPSLGEWKSFIAGRKEWSITTNFLIQSAADVKNRLYESNSLTVGQTYTLTVCTNTPNGATHLTGTALLKTYKVNATRGNLITGTFVFIGVSSLS